MDEKKYRGGAHAAGKRVSPKKEKPRKAAEPGEPKPKRKGLGALCAASAMSGAGTMMVVGWAIWFGLTSAGGVRRIKFSSGS